MGKKLWLWLWILALFILIFFCVKMKINKIASKKTEVPNSKIEQIVKIKAPVKVETKKDIHLKIDKNGENFSASGILNSKNSFENLSSKYNNLKNNGLKFDKSYENSNILTMMMNLNEVLNHFKTGFIEYKDRSLTVEGVVSSEEEKKLIDSTLSSLTNIKLNSHIVVETPKPKIEHIGKLSITKEGDKVNVSGTFTSQGEIDSLIKLLQDKGLDVKKELCIVDSDLKEDRWKEPFVIVLDDFLQFLTGTIQFDKDSFSIVGKTEVDGIKKDIEHRLSLVDKGDVKLSSEVTYIKPKPTKEQVQEEVNSILKLKSIRFKTATAELTDESRTILDEVADILLKNPDLKVKIEGHTDSDGEKNKNLILSQKRADSVKEYLTSKGVNSENLTAIGYGESKPLVKNSSRANKQINRRVEFIIIGE